MGTALGLLGLIAWIAGVLAISCAITYVMIKLTPGREKHSADGAPPSP